jgi:PBSX family phage portal protein
MSAAEIVEGSGGKKTTEVMKPVLKCIVIGRDQKVTKAEAEEREPSAALPEDPFAQSYDADRLIQPPFSMLTLAMMPEQNTELGPSLDAMQVNIEKMGHRIMPRPGVIPKDASDIPQNVQDEIDQAINFFDNAVLDEDVGSLSELRSRLRRDLETTGNAYLEVIPSSSDPKKPAGFEHIPSWMVRLRKQDEELTNYDVKRAVRVNQTEWRIDDFPTSKRFRRYAHIQETTDKKVWFKEWGDPRSISRETGEVQEGLAPEQQAHEMLHFKLYSPRSPYGLPRWIGHLFAIYGSRAAEEINYVTFDNNQIPALMLMATNVAVTQGSIDRMKEFVEERIQGNKNHSTIVMVEAEPVGEGMRDPGAMKLELKPLTEHQHTDALFQEYIQMNNDMVRRAFRLPPIFVGRAEDYNRAVAEASRKLAEEQIFAPERDAVDNKFTQTVIARLGLAYVMFKSNTPNVTDNFELTQLLATAERSGGLTPRISRHVVEDITNEELGEPDPSINPDVPFTYTMQERKLGAMNDRQNGDNGANPSDVFPDGDASGTNFEDMRDSLVTILRSERDGEIAIPEDVRTSLGEILQKLGG